MFKSQEEFRMNSKKIISSVSLATAVLATGIISQEEAHADSVDILLRQQPVRHS
ncbi:MAG: hypothetical protein ACLR0I_02170 [Streptococcus salivarius]